MIFNFLKNNTIIFCFFILASCDFESSNNMIFDIVIVAGQSNTHYGIGLDQKLDNSNGNIYQLGRSSFDNIIISANEPLHHHTAKKNHIGFALTFAKLFYNSSDSKNNILIIPCGAGGSSISKDWHIESFFYKDLIKRTKLILERFPNSQIKAFLWHQGEADVGNKNYEFLLNDFIRRIHNNIELDVPFIVGGMVPFWVNKSQDRISLQNIIKNTPNRISNVGYADPELPFLIAKKDDNEDEGHFDAKGQRELGKRYFEAYKNLIHNK